MTSLQVRGRFFWRGAEKLYLRGVTYGTFRPDEAGDQYPAPRVVERDLAAMAAAGFTCLRTYTVPPTWVLDIAASHGLLVLVGLPWEQHVCFLDEPGRPADILRRVREGARRCGRHPAVLGFVVGNEIPAPIVRWHGRRSVERFLRKLYDAVKTEAPDLLVTYVNYPTTEYLELPFIDFVSFNVYLEERPALDAYLARLQNLAGGRPLVLAEIGRDSRSAGEAAQAQTLRWQVETAFASGCAGTFVFAWTDEWYVRHLDEDGVGQGGYEVDDWDFGLTSRDRMPKPALTAVTQAYAQVPVADTAPATPISVVVCSFNGERTIRDCLEGLQSLTYPRYEVIVVDDGSTDRTAAIASEFPFRLIRTENRGLSAARNTGLAAASGEIVAFIDDDAWPDPDWLTYLAHTFRTTDHAGVGGPNLPPTDDGLVADCVAHAPGGPVHVLLGDRLAEHLPGCNMAFRRQTLLQLGGFDPRFRVAGDDVDLCWRLQDAGMTLGFHAGAIVWHRRRRTVRAYWRQQKGYGRAEALLEAKWPERYNAAGHASWAGRLYGSGSPRVGRMGRGRIYQGTWGSALFQSVYQRPESTWTSLPTTPEWQLALVLLATLGALGTLWTPLLAVLPLWGVGVAVPATIAVARARPPLSPRRSDRTLRWAVTALLFLLQPVARLSGRVANGLTPWRRIGHAGFTWPRLRRWKAWSASPETPERRLRTLQRELCRGGGVARPGGTFDDWDLELRGGMLARVRLRLVVEQHGAGRQVVRVRAHPVIAPGGVALATVLAALAAAAALDGSQPAAAALASLAFAVTFRALLEAGWASAQAAKVCPRVLGLRVGAARTPTPAPALQEAVDVPDGRP